MLKINLLPGAAARAAGESKAAAGDLRTFAVGMSIMLVLLAAGIMIFHSSQTKVLDSVTSANNQRELAVRQIKQRVADHPRVRNFRNLGMIWAFEADGGAPDFARRLFAAALDREVLLRPIGDTVYFMPPYVIDDAQSALLVDATLDALDAVLKD